jgi:ADP-heptose:LPS heptosyltransferase
VHGFDIALIGAPSEVGTTALAAAAAPRARAAERLLDLSGGLSLGELVALLSRADLVVSNDSGPMHLAAALGVPTLGLFGPETPRRYGPIGARTAALSDPPPCGPCINVHDNKLAACVMGRAECMTRISVDAVLAAALALVSETTRGAASGGGTRARAAREQGA